MENYDFIKQSILKPFYIPFDFFERGGEVFMNWLWILMFCSIAFYLVTMIASKVIEKKKRKEREQNDGSTSDSVVGTVRENDRNNDK